MNFAGDYSSWNEQCSSLVVYKAGTFSVTGRWVKVADANAQLSTTIHVGVVESTTEESETTLSVAVEASMGADFSFGGGSVSTSVSNTVREMMSSTFEM